MLRALPLALAALTLVAQDPLEARLRKQVGALASPTMKGRGNGYPELDAAAEHLRAQYRGMGLKVTVQRFPFTHRITRTEAKAILGRGDEEGRVLSWGKDVEAVGFSGDASFPNKALVFAGYGLKGAGYDDLEGIEVRGRVVLVSRKVPDLAPFAGLGGRERGMMARVQRLEKAGAAAVVFLEEGDSPRPLAREEGPVAFKIPVLTMPMRVLVPTCGDLAARLAKIAETGKPQGQDFSYAPWSYLGLTLRMQREEAQLPNVIATIPGRDPKLRGEVLVLGAHLDHLGLGERHSRGSEADRGTVHPGADDNASGTAVVLELARELHRKRPKRSIVLLHVSGEEEGLLGSAHWIQNPTVPLPSVKFMVNFDMVGRLDPAKPTLNLGGLGAPKAAVERAKTFTPSGVEIGADLGMAVGGSDHMSFAAAKIPTFFFFTGVHTDYHRPSDTVDKLNLKGMTAVARMGERVVRDLADGPTVPAFDPETAKLPAARPGGPIRAVFGILPDFGENPKGFRINGTTPGSPAEALNLKAGDILTSFGGRPVKNLYDYTEALSALKPGDRVQVKWIRGEEPMEGEVVLKGR